METFNITSQKKVQNSVRRKCDVFTFLGCTRANFGTLPREGHNSEHCPLQWSALGPVETSCSDQILMTVVNICQCCTIMPIHTDANHVKSLCQLSFETLELPLYRPIQHIISHSGMLWEVALLPVTKKWKWCMCDISFSRQHFFLREYRSLWTKLDYICWKGQSA